MLKKTKKDETQVASMCQSCNDWLTRKNVWNGEEDNQVGQA